MQKFRMSKTWLELTNYGDFASTVLEGIGAFLEGKSPSDVRMQYRDDENTFVHLISDDDLMDACRYLQPVQNYDELYRLCLRVHGSATPVPLHVAAERTNETKRRFTLPPKQLSYPESMATSCTSVTSKPETNKFKSPLDVFLEEKRKAMNYQKTRVSLLQAAVIESSFSSTGSKPYTRHTRSVASAFLRNTVTCWRNILTRKRTWRT